jgi:hypothetical protein
MQGNKKLKGKMWSVLLGCCKLASTSCVIHHHLGARLIFKIMKACAILHNMIVEDEGEMAEEPLDLNVVLGASIVLPPEVQKANNSNPCFDDIQRRNSTIHAHSIHSQLKNDLIEHIWQCYGSRGNN